ncbi:MAG: hypothetical protein ACOC2E_03775 [Bacteroidota bacterium]
MKTTGIIILILGIIGTIVFGIKAVNKSEAFNFLGIEIAMSSANWTPVIISAILLIVGLIMLLSRKK